MKKFICWLFGHSLVLLAKQNRTYNIRGGDVNLTLWKCQRCQKTFIEEYVIDGYPGRYFTKIRSGEAKIPDLK